MNEPLYIFIGVALGALIAVCLIWFGYWMGRNSTDKPVRSIYNPAKARREPAIDEPQGDIFNDAAYGLAEGEREPGIPTIMER